MAEALAIPASAAAIIQLAEYSKRFLKFVKEFQAKTTNLPLSFQIILSQQHLLLRGLEILEARARQNQIDDDSTPHVQVLSDACRKEIEYLKGILNKIAAPGTGSQSIKAIKAIRHEKDIQRSAATLKDGFDTLLKFYQITFMPSDITTTVVGNSYNEDAQSFVTVDESAQDTQEVQRSLVVTTEEEQYVLQQTTLMADSCKCRRPEVVQCLRSWSLGSASVSSEILTKHRRGCPFHGRCAKHNRLSFSLKYTSVMLRIIANVTMSIQYGAGGIALTPQLTLKGMRREGSPAFKLFEMEEWKYCRTASHAIAKIDQISLRLQRMFDERVASPYDLDGEGRSLVSAAYYCGFFFYSTWNGHDSTEKITGLLKLFGDLGVPFHGIGCRSLIAQYLEDVGGDLDPEVIGFLTKYAFENILFKVRTVATFPTHSCQALLCGKKFPDYAEVLDCNTLHVAILQRRESQVEDIIRIDPSAIHFRNALGQSALHVAADWPWATALLLASGADPYQVDTRGFTAVDYACDLEIYEVVRILLEAGSPLLEDNTLQGVMASCARDNSRELFKLIVFHLAIRRRELLQIAKTLFTENVLDTIVPLQEAVPDSSSYLLTEAVCTEICTVKPEYWSQSLRGLYQSRKMNPAAADVLYEAGFTYLEGRDPLGITPLTTTLTSAMTVWLYQKGASFTAWYTPPTKPKLLPPGPSMYTAIVRVVSSLLIHNTGDRRSVRFDRKEDIKALSIFLQDEFSECRDLCRCPCCSEGCSPQDMVLKSLWVSLKQGVSKYYTPALHRLARFVQQVDEILIELYGFWRDFHRANICGQRDKPMDKLELETLRELGVVVYEESEEEEYCDSLYSDEEEYCESLSSDEEEDEDDQEDEVHKLAYSEGNKTLTDMPICADRPVHQALVHVAESLP